jgi:hypothetical protein
MFVSRLSFAAWLLGLFALVLTGCGEAEEDPRGTRAGVKGTVTLDDKPLDRAKILFTAADGQKKIDAVGSIVNGAYEIPAEAGPLAGEMRVEIQPEQLELEEYEAAQGGDKRKRVPINTVVIPPQYNAQSKLKALVTEDEAKNVFDFQLQSKPK